MQAGKLPQNLLAELLERLPVDQRVLLGPGIGRDAAAIDMGNGKALVAAADPVTFAVDEIGRYAVHVNANDVACLGATPRWFIATAFFPEGADESLAREIFSQIEAGCAEVGALPIGGHTEITLGIDRPIISGVMLGEVANDSLLRPDSVQPGDHVVLATPIAIEGTAVLAREAPQALRNAGVEQETIDAAAAFLIEPGISIVTAAQAACATGAVRALHDATEGGIATALSEVAFAGGLQAVVRVNDIPMREETARICEAISLDPLGLLASGTLLVTSAPERCDDIVEALSRADVDAVCVAELNSGEAGAIMDSRSQQPLPRFERDELARYLESLG